MQLTYLHANLEPYWTTMLALLLLPPTLAALAYAGLVRVSREPRQRRRILATSASLILFMVPTFLLWRAGTWYWHGLVEKLLGIIVALAMLTTARYAARDPRGETERLAHDRRALARMRQDATRERVRQLI